MSFAIRAAALLVLAGLTSCASIVDGTNQSLSVQTIAAGTSVPSAFCTLQNGKGSWYVNTPGSVTVNRAYSPLNITCDKPGYQLGVQVVQSHTKDMAFGNALFGGVIGVGVDVSTGAAYDYPQLITVPLAPAPQASASAAAPSKS